jgi:hypothetical protein
MAPPMNHTKLYPADATGRSTVETFITAMVTNVLLTPRKAPDPIAATIRVASEVVPKPSSLVSGWRLRAMQERRHVDGAGEPRGDPRRHVGVKQQTELMWSARAKHYTHRLIGCGGAPNCLGNRSRADHPSDYRRCLMMCRIYGVECVLRRIQNVGDLLGWCAVRHPTPRRFEAQAGTDHIGDDMEQHDQTRSFGDRYQSGLPRHGRRRPPVFKGHDEYAFSLHVILDTCTIHLSYVYDTYVNDACPEMCLTTHRRRSTHQVPLS